MYECDVDGYSWEIVEWWNGGMEIVGKLGDVITRDKLS